MAGGEISRLPEDLVAHAISLTAPRDAARSSAVSTAFRAAADSDAVWARFLPDDLPSILESSYRDPDGPTFPEKKKELFFHLCDHPVSLADDEMSFGLERSSGAKCFMLSVMSLAIVWGDTPQYWRRTILPDGRFFQGAELVDVCWLEIRGKIQSRMLSPKTTYAAYFVFKIADDVYGLDFPPQETSVRVGDSESKHHVRLHHADGDGSDDDRLDARFGVFPFWRRGGRRLIARARVTGENRDTVRREAGHTVRVPQVRADGWMEVEMGEFYNEKCDDGEVQFSLTETKGGHWKRGLIVQGIEIRPKK